jgi:hypothetical protein
MMTPVPTATSKRTSPVLIGAVPLVIAFVAWTLLSDGDAEASSLPPQPPALFGETETCATAGTAAVFEAGRDEAAGRARLERYPFDARDGVVGVVLLRRAAACHRAAGADGAALVAEAEAARAQGQIERDYRMASFRFERALRAGRTRAALAESRWLLAVAGDRPGEWGEWLRDTERALRVRRSKQRRAS